MIFVMMFLKKFNIISLLLVAIWAVFTFSSCEKEEDYNQDSSLVLQFSADTLTFDTIFTTLGSTTLSVKVYNPSSQPVLIETVKPLGGSSSRFRLNVDGDKNLVANKVEIGAKDSLFIFVTVTINPNDESTPFLVEDEIEFNYNGKKQYLHLLAYGQNAIFHLPNQSRKDANGNTVSFSYAGCSEFWTPDLPHVIYGNCIVSGDSTLTMNPGTKIYFANGASLIIEKGGKLVAQGTFEEKIVFRNMRLENYYKELPGQWKGLIFTESGSGSLLDWVVVKNAVTGIIIDSTNNQSSFVFANTIIENMSNNGILVQNSTLKAENLLVANCRNYLLSIEKGGNYEFYQCTFANYWSYDIRKTAAVSLATTTGNPIQSAVFQNCIIYGSRQDELVSTKDTTTSYLFDGCLLRRTSTNLGGQQNIYNQDPDFVDYTINNYHLGAKSAAIGKGYTGGVIISKDLDDKDRAFPPSIGAYEYYK